MAVPGSRDVHLDASVAGGDDGGERRDGVGEGRRAGASAGHAAAPTVPWAQTMGSGRAQKAGRGVAGGDDGGAHVGARGDDVREEDARRPRSKLGGSSSRGGPATRHARYIVTRLEPNTSARRFGSVAGREERERWRRRVREGRDGTGGRRDEDTRRHLRGDAPGCNRGCRSARAARRGSGSARASVAPRRIRRTPSRGCVTPRRPGAERRRRARAVRIPRCGRAMDEPAVVADVMEISEQFPAPSTFGVFRGLETRHIRRTKCTLFARVTSF